MAPVKRALNSPAVVLHRLPVVRSRRRGVCAAWLYAAICLLGHCALAASGPADVRRELLKKGSQLTFIGDSITHGNSDSAVRKADNYHGLLQLFFATHYPALDLWTVNVGRSGDSLGGLIKDRLNDRDVFRLLPGVVKNADVALVMYGMNDGGSPGYLNPKAPPSAEARRKRRSEFSSRLNAVADDLLKKGIKVVILSPTMYDETVENKVAVAHGYNQELAAYAEAARKVAQEKNLMFVDLHTLMTRKNAEKQAANPKFSYTRDRVHPQSGNAIMLYSILKAFGLEGDVFNVTLDAGKSPPTVANATHARITELKPSSGGLTWTAAEEKLPLPVNPAEYNSDRAFEDVPFAEEFNRQLLTVTGLASGTYSLTIDETPVGKFTAKAIAAGVDLSLLATTPQYQAAWKLRELLYRKQVLETIKRDINSLRLNIESHFGSDPKRKDAALQAALAAENWDEPSVEKILGYMDRAVAEKKEDGKAVSGFFGHIVGQTRKHLAKMPEYNKELAALRTQVENLPEGRTYHYSLTSEGK